MTTIAVIDYGMGNLHSVAKALQHAGNSRVEVTADAERIRAADRVLFPGVGALRDCTRALQELDLTEVVRECARDKPFLGICLGMQALLDSSEENGGTRGLGIIPGAVRRLPDSADGERLKIPHIGWNQVAQQSAHPLWRNIPDNSWFYFVHSFYAAPDDPAAVHGSTLYGTRFASAIGAANVFAVQFHPEKSQRWGLQLLSNFLEWTGD